MFNRPGVKLMGICIFFFFLNSIAAIVGGLFLMKSGIDSKSGFIIFLSILIIILFPIEAFITVLPLYCLGQICANIEDMRNIEMKRENPEYSEKTSSAYGQFVSHYMVQETIKEREDAREYLAARQANKPKQPKQPKTTANKQQPAKDNKSKQPINANKRAGATGSNDLQGFVCDICGNKTPIAKKYDIIYSGKKRCACEDCIKELSSNLESFSILSAPKN